VNILLHLGGDDIVLEGFDVGDCVRVIGRAVGLRADLVRDRDFVLGDHLGVVAVDDQLPGAPQGEDREHRPDDEREERGEPGEARADELRGKREKEGDHDADLVDVSRNQMSRITRMISIV
jgi:hypothetical protein